MIGIVCSTLDAASANMAAHIIGAHGFESVGNGAFESGEASGIRVYLLQERLPYLESIDSFGLDAAYLLSKHKSAAGVCALTVHSTGNWTREAGLGGTPGQLSYAAPLEMLSVLRGFGSLDVKMEKTYEATHHGPMLKTPSLFAEVGGDDATIENKELARLAGETVFSAASAGTENIEFEKVAIGIGGTHYPAAFSRLAIEKGYAFSHIMPRYAVRNEDGTYNTGVLAQAMSRSSREPEAAVLEWKGLNAEMREHVIEELEEMGLDYEKV